VKVFTPVPVQAVNYNTIVEEIYIRMIYTFLGLQTFSTGQKVEAVLSQSSLAMGFLHFL